MSKKRIKLPKRIAGVKLPKNVRKGPVADFLNSSGGQVLLAEALVLAGGIYAARRTGITAEGARESVESASARLSHAFTEAIRAFRASLSDESYVPERELASGSGLDDELDDPLEARAESAGDMARATEVAEGATKKKHGLRPRGEDLPHAPGR